MALKNSNQAIKSYVVTCMGYIIIAYNFYYMYTILIGTNFEVPYSPELPGQHSILRDLRNFFHSKLRNNGKV